MPAEEAIQKFHSALRWGKPSAEIEPFLNEDPALIDAEDPKNGNHALHITAQNGHEELTKFLVGKGANINAQNKKGQTALHMSVEYDFYYQNLFLLENGADKTLKNGDGHAAILGIDGGKSGVEAFDGPMIKLKAIRDQKGMEEAYFDMILTMHNFIQVPFNYGIRFGMQNRKPHQKTVSPPWKTPLQNWWTRHNSPKWA
ncbi:unnamed protein product [Amoebophrya sp. A120]|nr:unnamed protein product [Amoebophrya sp. A120]|eukprot:GSA120T00015988001.1